MKERRRRSRSRKVFKRGETTVGSLHFKATLQKSLGNIQLDPASLTLSKVKKKI